MLVRSRSEYVAIVHEVARTVLCRISLLVSGQGAIVLVVYVYGSVA